MRFWALFCITYSASSNFPFLYLLCLFLVPFSPLHPNSVTVSTHYSWFPWWSDSKEPACNVGHPGLIPGLGRPPGEGNGNPLQYSCLENATDRGAWWATVHGVANELDKTERLILSRFLNYNAVFITAVQQSDSVIHAYIYTHIHILFIFFSIMFIIGYWI